MKLKKILTVLLIAVLSLFIGLNGVLAAFESDINSDTGTSTYTNKTITPASCSVGFYYKYNHPAIYVYGVRVSILDKSSATKSSNVTIKTIDIVNTSASGYYVSSGQKTKVEYLTQGGSISFSKAATKSNHVYTASQLGVSSVPNWINSNDPNQTISEWLNENNHANIDAILKEAGFPYDFDANNKAKYDDKLVIEPIFGLSDSKKLGTAYEFLKSNSISSSDTCNTVNSATGWLTSYFETCTTQYQACHPTYYCAGNCDEYSSREPRMSWYYKNYVCTTGSGRNEHNTTVSSMSGCSRCTSTETEELTWTFGMINYIKNTLGKDFLVDDYTYSQMSNCISWFDSQYGDGYFDPYGSKYVTTLDACPSKSDINNKYCRYYFNSQETPAASDSVNCHTYAENAVDTNCNLEKYYQGYGLVIKRAVTAAFAKNTHYGVSGVTLSYDDMTIGSAISNATAYNLAGVGVFSIWDTLMKDIKFNIKITKVSDDDNSQGGSYKINNATFSVYNSSGKLVKTDSTGSNGVYELSGLDEGTYTLVETVPSGYSSINTNITCKGTGYSTNICSSTPYSYGSGKVAWTIKLYRSNKNFTYNASTNRLETTMTITNKKTCEELFSQYDKYGITGRVKLYERLYKDTGLDYRKLLDLNNKTAKTACQPLEYTKTVSEGCLSIKTQKLAFSESNLSNYSEIIKIDSTHNAYCSVDYTLANSFKENGVYNFTTDNYYFNTSSTSVLSGQKLFPLREKITVNGTDIEGVVAKGTLTKDCYIISLEKTAEEKSSNVGDVTTPGELLTTEKSNVVTEYTQYVKQISADNKTLVPTVIYTKNNISTTHYTKTYDAYYSIQKVYAYYGTGEITTKASNNARELGYSIFSDFDDLLVNEKTPLKVQNSILYTDYLTKSNGYRSKKAVTTKSTENKCLYYPKQQIIVTENPGKSTSEDDLKVEYRTIDTTYAFPGESGTSTRQTGANWCGTDTLSGTGMSITISNCSNSNNIVTQYIKNAVNSYGRVASTGKSQSAKYSITLNATNIKKIREESKNMAAYDDFSTMTYTDSNGSHYSKLLQKYFNIK